MVRWGCRTGFYLLVADDAKSKEIFPLVKELFQFISNYNDLVPGACARDCGNYLSMDLPIARWESNKFLGEVLEQMKNENYIYP